VASDGNHEDDRSGRFVWSGGDVVVSQCMLCARKSRRGGPTPVCQAFPGAIPEEILDNLADHRKPYPGDTGFDGDEHLLFQPDPAADPGMLAAVMSDLDQL
jgi:hypothetical protein